MKKLIGMLFFATTAMATSSIEHRINEKGSLFVCMNTTTQSGKTIILKNATESDAEYLFKWYTNQEANAMLRDGKPLSKDDAQARAKDIIEKWDLGNPFSSFIIFDEKDQRIGVAIIGPSGFNGTSELLGAIMPEDKKEDLFKQGIMKAAMSVIAEKYIPLLLPNSNNETAIPGAKLALQKPLQRINAGGDLHNLPAIRLFIESDMQAAETKGKKVELSKEFAVLFDKQPTNGRFNKLYEKFCKTIEALTIESAEEQAIFIAGKHVATIIMHPKYNKIKFKWTKSFVAQESK